MMVSVENSSIITNESWFIPFDIVMIICSALAIILTALFMFIIIIDKKCHTVLMMLVANTCLSGFIVGCSTLGLSTFTLRNDLKRIHHQDSFCVFRAYIGYVSCALFSFSFLLQAVCRYLIIAYPTRLQYQTFRFQFTTIFITWIFCFTSPFPFLFTNEIIYNVDNQICQLVLQFSFAIVFVSLCIYIIPIWMLMIVYFKLILYVHKMSKRVTPVNTLRRAQRQLKMIHRIVILVAILVVFGCPYISLDLMSFFTTPPKYHYRIAFIFLDVSMALVTILLLPFTDPLKAFVMNE